MIRNYRRFVSNLILMAGMVTTVWTVVGNVQLRADGPFIIDSWFEEPKLSVSYIWNLFERRDGWYDDNWSDDQLAAVDTFEFGAREAFKLMDLSDIIDAQHNGDAWIKLYNVATNNPDNSSDYPPHINIISYWGKAGEQYQGAVNGHFYASTAGALNPSKTWYAWDTAPTCQEGVRNPGVNVWTKHVDRDCDLLWEERVTSSGELEIRRASGQPVYLLRNKAASDLDILRDGVRVRNVRRVFHNAWINYPKPYPDGQAKVVWEIRDYEAQTLTTETIIARPDTGKIISHERIATPLNGANNAPPTVSLQQPANGASFLPDDAIVIVAQAADSDGTVTQVEFFAGDTKLGAVSASPWQWTWNSPSLGEHTLKARATDDDGDTTVSAPINISISDPENVALTIDPAARSIVAGAQFSMTIAVQTQGLTVDRVEAYLNFDASVVEVVRVEPASTLSNVENNTFDNQDGHIDFVASHSGSSPPNAGFTLATITFRALDTDAKTSLTFNANPPRQTAIFENGVNYLSSTGSGQISVIPLSEPDLYLPLVNG